MIEFKRLPISSIFVGVRQRPVDLDHAEAIASSMKECGLIHPITVRLVPNQEKGAKPYCLVAGGHRLHAATMNNWSEIEAIVVKADVEEAILIEISENIFRNDLSALNRAMFVAKYRETWETVHGPITQGGRRFISPSKRARGHDDLLKLAPGKEFSERVKSRLGLGERTYRRAMQIALNLRPELRQAIRGTKHEDDQAMLVKLSKIEPEKQCSIAAALNEGAPLPTVLKWMEPEKGRQDRTEWNVDRFTNAWHLMGMEQRKAVLSELVALLDDDDRTDLLIAMNSAGRPVTQFAEEPEGGRVVSSSKSSVVPLVKPLAATLPQVAPSPLWAFCNLPLEAQVPPVSLEEIEKARKEHEALEGRDFAKAVDALEATRRLDYQQQLEQKKEDGRKNRKERQAAKVAAQEARRKADEKRRKRLWPELSGYFNQEIADILVDIMLEVEGLWALPLPRGWKEFHKHNRLSDESLAKLLDWLKRNQYRDDVRDDFKWEVDNHMVAHLQKQENAA